MTRSKQLLDGRYRIVRTLGQGSFAQTVLADDIENQRQVAIKMLLPRLIPDWKTYELFERECAVLRHLQHPGVPAIHESFRTQWNGGEAACLVMEYVDGPSIAAALRENRHFASSEVEKLFVELLQVLDYLHTRLPPVLHRDIKPDNIILRSDGAAVLVDFGAVRTVHHDSIAGGSTVVGTYGYMPFEQIMGRAMPSSDLYALAATMLHVVTGRRPQDFMTDSARLEIPKSLSCGEPLRGVLATLLSADPAQRHQSAAEVMRKMQPGVVPARDRVPVPLSGGSVPREGDASMKLANLDPASVGTLRTETPQRHPHVVAQSEPATIERYYNGARYTARGLLYDSAESGTAWTIREVLSVTVYSVLTMGVLPMVIWRIIARRKKNLQHFLTHGVPTDGRILEMNRENVGFECYLLRVKFEFDADGATRVDSDAVLPMVGREFRVGGPVRVLHLSAPDYRGIVVG